MRHLRSILCIKLNFCFFPYSPKEQQLSNLMELSQNFPSYARPLSKTSVPKDLKKEVKKNREVFFEKMSVQPSDAALFINGLYFDMDYVDIFTILETIKSEAKVKDLQNKTEYSFSFKLPANTNSIE